MSSFRLSSSQASLLVVDIQERLCAAMEPEALERLLKRTGAAIEGAKALKLPILVTEQYPKGLGPTHARVRERLGEHKSMEKLEFSGAVPDVLAALQGRKQVLLAGMETHICVFQTARDLVEKGFEVWLLADAVLSRSAEDRRVGFELCKEVGARVTTVESALFDMLGRAGSPEFKAISAAVR
ncbi:isochorismatase family protein [Hyalangium rubrum]|uniref:Isochorismatase family protein n=1 Tax=Hyalangium rubrum TaxID=3103134 RepID=A0ABU5GVB1_9BACT|nr:isochorismatase family protein [Hyalangium sp. s54d21]MDY7224842.1 isochorismatase family protein [Hyalangium sp. s54d21]